MMQDSYADSLWKSSTEWEKHLRGYIYIFHFIYIPCYIYDSLYSLRKLLLNSNSQTEIYTPCLSIGHNPQRLKMTGLHEISTSTPCLSIV